MTLEVEILKASVLVIVIFMSTVPTMATLKKCFNCSSGQGRHPVSAPNSHLLGCGYEEK